MLNAFELPLFFQGKTGDRFQGFRECCFLIHFIKMKRECLFFEANREVFFNIWFYSTLYFVWILNVIWGCWNKEFCCIVNLDFDGWNCYITIFLWFPAFLFKSKQFSFSFYFFRFNGQSEDDWILFEIVYSWQKGNYLTERTFFLRNIGNCIQRFLQKVLSSLILLLSFLYLFHFLLILLLNLVLFFFICVNFLNFYYDFRDELNWKYLFSLWWFSWIIFLLKIKQNHIGADKQSLWKICMVGFFLHELIDNWQQQFVFSAFSKDIVNNDAFLLILALF